MEPIDERSAEIAALKAALESFSKMAKELKKERDEAREAFAVATDQLVQCQSALREAREAIRELLGMVPRPSCDMFHHSKKYRHGYDEPCPLVDRYNAKIKKAEEAAK